MGKGQKLQGGFATLKPTDHIYANDRSFIIKKFSASLMGCCQSVLGLYQPPESAYQYLHRPEDTAFHTASCWTTAIVHLSDSRFTPRRLVFTLSHMLVQPKIQAKWSKMHPCPPRVPLPVYGRNAASDHVLFQRGNCVETIHPRRLGPLEGHVQRLSRQRRFSTEPHRVW